MCTDAQVSADYRHGIRITVEAVVPQRIRRSAGFDTSEDGFTFMRAVKPVERMSVVSLDSSLAVSLNTNFSYQVVSCSNGCATGWLSALGWLSDVSDTDVQ